MKKILYALIAIVILVLLGIFVFMNMPKASVEKADAFATMKASELYNAFSQDENKANSTYLGKVIEVHGNIIEITEDEKGAKVVLIGNGKNPQVMVTMNENQKSKLSKYKINDPLKIKAQVNGLLMEVIMNKGSIVN